MASEANLSRLRRQIPNWGRLATFLQKKGFLLSRNTEAKYFGDGADYFEDLILHLKQAETYIHAPLHGYGLGIRTPKESGHRKDFGWGGVAGAYLAGASCGRRRFRLRSRRARRWAMSSCGTAAVRGRLPSRSARRLCRA